MYILAIATYLPYVDNGQAKHYQFPRHIYSNLLEDFSNRCQYIKDPSLNKLMLNSIANSELNAHVLLFFIKPPEHQHVSSTYIDSTIANP